MTDTRFFRAPAQRSLGEIARAIGGSLSDASSAACRIRDIASLETAGEGDISVFTGAPYADAFRQTRAEAVVTTRELGAAYTGARHLIYVDEPRLAYTRIGYLFYPIETFEPGIDPLAVVGPAAVIGAGSRIEAGAVIGAGAEIGAHCHIQHNAVIGAGVVLGAHGSVGPNSSVSHALIGEGVRIASCVTIGGEGFGFVPGPEGLLRMRQLGRVIIGDHVEIGANSAIDRGAAGDTVIGRGSMLDNLVQIGHNVRVGCHCVISGQAGIAGSTTIGDWVMIGGQAAISDHLTIGARARIAGKSGVMRDVAPGMAVAGYPAAPVRQWHRQTAWLARLAMSRAARKDALEQVR